MESFSYSFSNADVNYNLNFSLESLEIGSEDKKFIYLTDENVLYSAKDRFNGKKIIVVKAGEQYKQFSTVENIVTELIELKADRHTTLVAVGGGVLTDLGGFAASIYMRGISHVFVPTTILAMVDAAIGGKNGVDVGLYKNMAGIIRQPQSLYYDFSFLNTLPPIHWNNGFAEIIKHALIKDEVMFDDLWHNDISFYQTNPKALKELIVKNVRLKSSVVVEDEFEKGNRKLLNFGHTLGHAIENITGLLHGEAIAIGMMFAAFISEKLLGFSEKDKIAQVLFKYKLPFFYPFEAEKALELLKMDKKKNNDSIHFVLLKTIGNSCYEKISFEDLSNYLTDFIAEN